MNGRWPLPSWPVAWGRACWRWGQVLSGTGRYQGATGRFKMRSRTDLDALADGALGDYFAVGEADIQLPK